jgi:glutamate-1-semialdehyde 2,1-aminomutase
MECPMDRIHSKSAALFERAQKLFPGGVNSPVRAFKAVDRHPFFVERGEGALLIDVDGNSYIDFINSWGPLVLGHAHPQVVQAVSDQLQRGLSYGACSEPSSQLAELIQKFFPSMEMLRFVNSGTEAAMSAIRLARGYTGRTKILKFTGHYHGHVDSLLVDAGSGVATLGIASCAGIPEAFTQETICIPFNDSDALQASFQRYGDEIAAVIIEPVAGNAGFIPPLPEFLSEVRTISSNYGALLIFDEVMTGFRVSLGGAQELYTVCPDLTMLGKVIGGGMPVGAFGGRRAIMQQLAPLGPVYQAGTLSGNPVAMAAGIATLTQWSMPGVFEQVAAATARVAAAFRQSGERHNIPVQALSIGAMFGFFFNANVVTSYEEAKDSNGERFKRFFSRCLDKGVYFAPSQFEAGFVSAAHDAGVLDRACTVIDEVFQSGI